MPIRIKDSSEGIEGFITPSMGAFTASFEGENTDTPDVDGEISRALGPFTASFRDPGSGFPRLFSAAVGGGGQTQKWSQTAEGSETANVAKHDIAIVNFIFPGDSASVVSGGVANLRNFNPNLLIGEYKDAAELTNSPADNAHYDYLDNNYFKAGSGGAVDGDGLAREVDGKVEPSFPFKQADVNRTDYFDTLDPQGRYPYEYMLVERWRETYDTDYGTNYDFKYEDIGNWTKRAEETDQDWNRDGTASSYDFDGASGDHGPSITRVRIRACDTIRNLHQVAWGKPIEFLWNAGSNFDWFDGARADTGPTILTAADQPPDWETICNGSECENWGRLMGFNDGEGAGVTSVADLDRSQGNFERGFKQITRFRDFLVPSQITGTKILFPQFHIDRDVPAQIRWQVARYLAAVATIAGVYCCFEDLDTHRTAALLDEYIADDAEGTTVQQFRNRAGYLGNPVGAFPSHGESFVQGTRGGIIASSGVYGMEFESGLVLANPKGNGQQTFALPSPNPFGGAGSRWLKFLGVQSPSVNDGSVVWDSDDSSVNITMDETTGLFLLRG